MRILIADDQEQTRLSLRLLLNTVPWVTEIREAGNGREAVQLIPVLHPDGVLIDACMPVMDGVEAARIIKETWPQVKVILLSMYHEYQESALQVGADAFVSKGESPEILLNTICEILNPLEC